MEEPTSASWLVRELAIQKLAYLPASLPVTVRIMLVAEQE